MSKNGLSLMPAETPAVFIVGDAASPLTRQRVQIAIDAGYDVHWFTTNAASPAIHGVTLYRSPFKGRRFIALGEAFYLAALMVKVKPDLVHVFYANYHLINLAVLCGRKLIVTVMGSDISPSRLKRWSLDRFLVKCLLQKAEVITSKSEYLDQLLIDLDLSLQKIRRITWGIDPRRFHPKVDAHPLRRGLGIDPETFVLFSVRACKPLYQHEKIIRAFDSFYRRTDGDSILLITTLFSQPGYLKSLRQLVGDLGLTSNVMFLPPVPPDAMPAYYNLSDAVVSIPRSDGMPQSLYESMACGCFHILGDLPQYRELLYPGENGMTVSLDDTDELCRAFEWVHRYRRELATFQQANAARVLEVADQRKQTQLVKELYAEQLSQCDVVGKHCRKPERIS
jgi:glycosyltransferase involved in cell wall biosynthesis